MTNNVMAKNRPSKKHGKKFSIHNFMPTIPHFSTLLFGILIGIFGSCLTLFMFATSDITLKIPTITIGKTKLIATPVQEVAVVQEPRFDFYTELAKNESDSVKDLKSTPKTINGYVVQAGSFRKISDADALKAKLTLNGYAAKVEPIKQSDGEVWQRVIIGTFKTEPHAKALQQKLKALNIDSILALKYTD